MSKTVTIIFCGDVVGEPGRRAIGKLLPALKNFHKADLCVVNGENSAGGAGITPKTFTELREAGADVVTTGDHLWDNKEVLSILGKEPRLLRPANYPARVPGNGFVVADVSSGIKIGVLNLMGRTFVKNLDCPFQAAERELKTLRQQTSILLVDMHAEATSEKIALARFLDGQVSVVVGTHTHVQTADEQIFPKGTAFLCDAGMTGSHESVLGREIAPVIELFLTQTPQRLDVAKGNVRLNGAVIQIEATTGRAIKIERINIPLEETAG